MGYSKIFHKMSTMSINPVSVTNISLSLRFRFTWKLRHFKNKDYFRAVLAFTTTKKAVFSYILCTLTYITSFFITEALSVQFICNSDKFLHMIITQSPQFT